MRILFHHRIASRDGQAVHIEELMAALQSLGHETVLVGPPNLMRTGFGGSNPLVDRIKQSIPKALYELLEVAYNLKAFLRLRAAVQVHRPDVIYERFSLFLFAGIWVRRLYRLPMLLEVNSPLYEERAENDGLRLHRLGRWAQRLLWNRVDHVLPVTGVLARTVAEYGVAPSRITVIPNGVNPERFGIVPDTQIAKIGPRPAIARGSRLYWLYPQLERGSPADRFRGPAPAPNSTCTSLSLATAPPAISSRSYAAERGVV